MPAPSSPGPEAGTPWRLRAWTSSRHLTALERAHRLCTAALAHPPCDTLQSWKTGFPAFLPHRHTYGLPPPLALTLFMMAWCGWAYVSCGKGTATNHQLAMLNCRYQVTMIKRDGAVSNAVHSLYKLKVLHVSFASMKYPSILRL